MSHWSQKLDAYLAVTKLSKKELALKLGISINTLGKWWGRREPSPEHATRIRQLLQEDTPTTVLHKSFTSPEEDTMTVEKVTEGERTNEANFGGASPSSSRATDFPAGVIGDEVIARQLPTELLKRGERYGEKPVVVSLIRTKCPFCQHDVDRFRNCVYCGQHLVWANIPMERDEL